MARVGKDTKKLLDALEAQGFTVRETRNNHVTVYKGHIWVTTFASTPSDARGATNSLAALRRAGFVWGR